MRLCQTMKNLTNNDQSNTKESEEHDNNSKLLIFEEEKEKGEVDNKLQDLVYLILSSPSNNSSSSSSLPEWIIGFSYQCHIFTFSKPPILEEISLTIIPLKKNEEDEMVDFSQEFVPNQQQEEEHSSKQLKDDLLDQIEVKI